MRRQLLLGLILLLAACNGDDGGTGASPVFSGTYRGTATFVVTVGPASQGASGPIVIVVSGSVVQVGQFPPTTLSGNTFHTSLPFTFFNQPGSGLRCTQGTFDVEGTFAGTAVGGPIFSQGLRCNGFAVTFTGSYTATLTAQARRDGAEGADITTTVREVLIQVLTR